MNFDEFENEKVKSYIKTEDVPYGKKSFLSKIATNILTKKSWQISFGIYILTSVIFGTYFILKKIICLFL